MGNTAFPRYLWIFQEFGALNSAMFSFSQSDLNNIHGNLKEHKSKRISEISDRLLSQSRHLDDTKRF